MKKFFSFAILCMAGSTASAQFIYKIKADSVLITNDSCTAELILENSTKNVCGFLFNKGKGRTEFRSALIKLNDSTYVVGCDTLHLHSGIGGVTANNGLTANTSTNVQLGGNLLHNTQINTDTFNLKISGVNTNDSIAILNINNNTPINSIGNATSLRIVSPNADGININAQNGVIVNTPGSALVAHTSGTAIATYGVGSTPGIAVQVEGGPGVNSIFTSGIGLSASGTTGTGIQSTVTTGKAAIFTINPTTTNTIATIMDIYRKSSGTAANEIGGSIQYHTQTTSSFQDRISNTLISKWTNATDASRTSQFEVWGVNNGSAIARKLALAGNGQLTLDGYSGGAFQITDTTVNKPLTVDASGNVKRGYWFGSGGGGSITANNGLTANTSTNVQLGGALLQNTTIDLDSNYFAINNSENPYFEIDPNGDHTFKFGDISNANNGNRLEINDNTGAINFKSGSSYWLQISTSSDYSILETSNNAIALTGADHKVNIGDVYASGNSTKITIDDAISKTSITKALRLSNYGAGTHTGTATYNLAVDATGNVIESSLSGGSGISTLNTLTGSSQSFAAGTSGTDFNISSSGTTHTFNIPDASTSARGLVTTGSQNFSGIKTFTGSVNANAGLSVTGSTAFIQQVLQITNPNAGVVIGASADYRKTNAGGGIHPELGSAIAAVTAGTLSYNIDRNNGNGFVFCAANGTRQISRASINIANLNNTAGSESGDLIFLTQSGGTAMNEKFRIGSGGLLSASSYASGNFYQNDTASYKPVVIDASGNIFQSSWLGNAPGGGSGYSTVQEGGTALTQRSNLNFGYGVTAIDNSGSNRTDVNLDVANSESFLTSDVTLTANTYSDAVSFSLVAGTWMIAGNATVESPNNTAQRVTYKLWDGTTVYQAGEAACNAMGGSTKGYVSVPVSGLIVLAGTTTIKISVASTAASLIKATPGDNSTGTTNKATSFRAVRIK